MCVQFLNEKRLQAASARDKAHGAARMLLDEMRQLEAQYHLSQALSPQGGQGLLDLGLSQAAGDHSQDDTSAAVVMNAVAAEMPVAMTR